MSTDLKKTDCLPAREGMSMVELMVGVIILALVLIPSLYVLISNTQTITSTRDHVMAGFIAQRIIETIRAYPFDYLDKDQYSTQPDEVKKTLEYDMGCDDDTQYDRVKIQEKVNNIDYKVTNPKVELVKYKNDTTSKPRLAVISFRIEYKGLDGKNHFLDVQTAVSR